MKSIIFDVDGVIIISAEEKSNCIKDILIRHNLYEAIWVKEILALSLNRKTLLDKIYDIIPFDRQRVLSEINTSLQQLEAHPVENKIVVDFIKKNYSKYIFFTNTSLPKKSLERILKKIWIAHCFKELFAGEDGMKLDNTYTILDAYGLFPEEVLFIDDTLIHIQNVSESGVHTLYFDNLNIDINQEIKKI